MTHHMSNAQEVKGIEAVVQDTFTSYTPGTDDAEVHCIECVGEDCESCVFNDKNHPCYGCNEEKCDGCITF